MDNQTIERVKISLANPEIGPETVALMLSKACNLRCLYCRGGKLILADSSEELTTKDLFDMFRDARDFKVKDINLGGFLGEPFCRKDIIAIIQEIKRLGLSGTMTTNGSFLNSEVAKIMTDCAWDIIRISLDSADATIQHLIRPAANQKPYFHNIVEFLDTLKKTGSRVRVILNVVISKFNFKGLAALVEFANSYKNICSIDLLKLMSRGLVYYGDLQLNKDEIREFKSILFSLKNNKKLKCQDDWGEFRNNERFKTSNQEKMESCFVNYYILSIDSNGGIMKCPQYQLNVPGLNLKNSSLKTLWRNELLQFRQSLLEKAPCYRECCSILKEENKLILDCLSREKKERKCRDAVNNT
mgnify:CR=1 FL=1